MADGGGGDGGVLRTSRKNLKSRPVYRGDLMNNNCQGISVDYELSVGQYNPATPKCGKYIQKLYISGAY